MLFEMGDGNQSLATAKQCWENLKKGGAEMDHPSRFALVELMNIHDDGNQFEPIHRRLFNVDIKDILCEVDFFVSEMGRKFTFVDDGEYAETDKKSKLSKEGAQEITFQFTIVNGAIHITGSPFVLAYGTLTSFLDN